MFMEGHEILIPRSDLERSGLSTNLYLWYQLWQQLPRVWALALQFRPAMSNHIILLDE